ncbi:4-hydroxythreonine-4-phosphate dehydrogenase PdxA [Crateriforma spongiae]|uniref:4-hydroxythreonine-4-phosphate dehydrogenase PdxA n=1 Tax=Crateriforma spongiae TaxID=2724528 RepID=UPI0014486762|nr:4-hydroxythreonine-4-phosphate dehydrogenase PdxA [Crateriforma spongiae]
MSTASPASLKRIPRLAVTVGDVAGAGPELALRCTMLSEITDRCQPILVGPADVIRRIGGLLDLPVPEVAHDWADVEASDRPMIWPVGDLDAVAVVPGRPDAATGAASLASVQWAIDAAIDHRVAGVVTGPIQKEAWHQAGCPFPGHTELLADRTGVTDFRMMLTSPQISCVLVTIHEAIADVPKLIRTSSIIEAARLGHAAVSRRLGRPARVTVLGLNPHAGEGGLFSHGEEERLIQPAVAQLSREGIPVTGPLPPDTAFTPRQRDQTDVYVCMYHDQGLIPLKALAFDEAVNVTLGLPIVRTSVDHGTALDLAWTGRASHHSMQAAIEMAIDLAAD